MNNVKPRVSIGMPVYNGEEYIEEAIDSILSQTYTDFELIISDNASTDKTPEICRAYLAKDPRIRYFRSEKNLGAAPNWNRVLELSVGECFMWAAHDNNIAPTLVEKCVDVLDLHPNVILCYSSATIINEHGEFVVNQDSTPELASLERHQCFRQFMLTDYSVYHLAGLMRVDVVKELPGIGKYPASDEVFLAELSLYGKFYEIPERLFLYRRHLGNSTFGSTIPNQQIQTQFKQRDRVLFFDEAKKDKIVLPTWLFLEDGFRALMQAPINAYQKLYCSLQMVRWALRPDHFRALGKDVLLAIRQLIVRSNIEVVDKTYQEA